MKITKLEMLMQNNFDDINTLNTENMEIDENDLQGIISMYDILPSIQQDTSHGQGVHYKHLPDDSKAISTEVVTISSSPAPTIGVLPAGTPYVTTPSPGASYLNTEAQASLADNPVPEDILEWITAKPPTWTESNEENIPPQWDFIKLLGDRLPINQTWTYPEESYIPISVGTTSKGFNVVLYTPRENPDVVRWILLDTDVNTTQIFQNTILEAVHSMYGIILETNFAGTKRVTIYFKPACAGIVMWNLIRQLQQVIVR